MVTLRRIIIFICLWSGVFNTAYTAPISVALNKTLGDFLPCDKGWYYFDEKCYRIQGQKSVEKLPWDGALSQCKALGGDLASIHSKEEQDFILHFLMMNTKDKYSNTWIGLNDHDKESNYRWTDGTATHYTNWDKDEPSGLKYGEEDCIMMWFEREADRVGKWHDNRCSLEYSYICQKRPNDKKHSPNPIYCTSNNGRGWKFQKSCYHVVVEKKSWQNAENHCKDKFSGHLVTVLDMTVDFFLKYILKDVPKDMWIGIKMRNQFQQKWTSGWHVSYDGFNKEREDFRPESCVIWKNRNEWTVIPCSEKNSFVCETSKMSSPVLKSPAKGSHCPDRLYDWRDLDGEYCYHIETENFVSWYEASFHCRRRGGHLASLHSDEESRILLPFVKRSKESVLIGLFRSLPDEEHFEWTDGSKMDYENWRHDQPDHVYEKCGEVFASNMKWNDINCVDKRSYICSVKKVVPDSPVAEEIVDTTVLSDSSIMIRTCSTILQNKSS